MNPLLRLPLLTSLFLALLLSGCSAFKVYDENKEIGHFGAISGRTISADNSQPLVVVIQDAASGAIEDAYAQPTAGYFLFTARPGSYRVAAFIDRNGDFTHQPDSEESAHSSTITLSAGKLVKNQSLLLKTSPQTIPGALKDIVIGGDTGEGFTNFSLGNVVALDDTRFSQNNASTGLWKPMTFLKEQRPGIYFLEPYAQEKTPVLFIHGINGSPADFREMVKALDRERYQPWFVYYPSGVPLKITASYIMRWLNTLRAEYGFSEITVVAHSMGGLVAKTTLHLLRQQSTHPELATRALAFISFATPWNGHPAAKLGVDYSPVVLGSWRDIAPQSEFMTWLHEQPMPQGMRYTLVFSYKGGFGSGQSGDGTVPLASQLWEGMQYRSQGLIGIDTDHDGILSHPVSLETIKHALDGVQMVPSLAGTRP